MFDTGQASRVLQLQSHALAYLLMRYCNVQTDKAHQLDDWRIRPLTAEQLFYARCDTHYLLFIYDIMRQELINQGIKNGLKQNDLLKSAYNKSREVTLQVYSKPILKDNNYYILTSKNKQLMNETRYRVLLDMLQWRDDVAREEDENPKQYILENDVLFEIVRDLPQTTNDLQAIKKFHQYKQAKRRQNDIINIILKHTRDNAETAAGTQPKLMHLKPALGLA